MPMVQVTYQQGQLSSPQLAQLSERLTHVLLMIEGGIDNPNARSIAYVLFNELPPNRWAIGGAFDDTYASVDGRILVQVTVPEGAMQKEERRKAVVVAVHEALRETRGLPKGGESTRGAWVMIREHKEGYWGAGGDLHGIADIVKFARAPEKAKAAPAPVAA